MSITGFHVIQRENGEEDHEYWEPIRYLRSYMWMFRREKCPTYKDCLYCNDKTVPGCCIIFTYESSNTCENCGIVIPKNEDYCSYACKVQECGCKGHYTCCGQDD
jgi:hypothetical protein